MLQKERSKTLAREPGERGSHSEVQELLHSLEQPAFALRLDGTLLSFNQNLTRLLRRQPTDLANTPWTNLLSPSDRQPAEAFFKSHASSPFRKETFVFLTPEGTGKPLQVHLTQATVNGEVIVLAVCRNPALEFPFLTIFQRRFEIEALVCNLSADFLRINTENIEEVINISLGKIGRFVGANHAYLILYSEDETKVEKVFEWSSTGSFSRKGRISGISLSVIQDRNASPTKSDRQLYLKAKTGLSQLHSPSKPMYSEKASDPSPTLLVYPPIAQQELNYLRSRGISSLLGLPVKVNGKAVGYFGIDSCEDRTWVDEDMSLLRLSAELFANSLLRFRAEGKLQTTDAQYRALIQNFPGGMVLLFDKEIRFFLAEGEDFRNLPFFKKTLEGKTFAEILPGKRYESLLTNLRATFHGKSCITEIEFQGEWYEIRVAPIRNSLNEIFFGMIVAMRITKRKHMEAEICQVRSHETTTAVEIQNSLLSSIAPTGIAKADFGLFSCPSQLVDGDFTDFLHLNEHTIDIIIGDVMGKGIPAALIGAATKDSILRLVMRLVGRGKGQPPPVEQITAALQKDIGHRLSQLSVFVTLIYCRIDLSAQRITLMNAGHPPVLHDNNGTREITAYPSGAAPLGLMNDIPMSCQTAGFSWQDRLLLFSDGILDTRNKQGAFFGEDRLRDLFSQSRPLPSQAATEYIFHEVQTFADSTQLHDDLTCLLIDLHGGKGSDKKKRAL